MGAKKPLIKCFQVEGCHYVYDSNTNQISRVSPVIWDILGLYGEKSEGSIEGELSGSYSHEEVREGMASIRMAREQMGLFRDNGPGVVRPFFTREEYEERMSHSISHMILGVTQQCNFRCQYCIYSGGYQNFRSHSLRRMSEETALKAVDFFAGHSGSVQEPVIGFYGGEPLLEVGLIKKVIEYGRRRMGERLSFSLTTNGSLLDDEMISFLVRENISLLVSVDGPQEIHDRYRRFKDGKATFQRVYEGLKRFRDKDEELFCRQVGIMAVIAPPVDYLVLHHFFTTEPLFKDVRVMTSLISDDSGDFMKQFGPDDLEFVGVKELFGRFRQDLIEKGRCEDGFLKSLFEKPLLNLQKRKMFKGHGEWHHPKGTCEPGIRRVFVTVDGDLQVCERASDTLKIGDLDNGYDIEGIFGIIRKYCEPLTRNCRDCWAIRLCNSCYASRFSIKGYDGDGNPPDCDFHKESILGNLVDFCQILQENPQALDYMDGIMVR